MFGDSSSTASTRANAPSFPQLPVFLLPSFGLPFRRRRTSSNRTPSTSSTASSTAPTRPGSTAIAAAVAVSYESSLFTPSLSSSPTSSLSTSPASPTSPTSYFSSFATADPFAKSHTNLHDSSPPATQTAVARGPAAISAQPPHPRVARLAPDTLRCGSCSADLGFGAQIVSKGFTGRHGRAYLVSAPLAANTPSCPGIPPSMYAHGPSSANAPFLERADDPAAGNLVNIRVGRPESRQLVTGAHVVADISCVVCGAKLGWKYVDAKEAAQRYKVGKFILETQRVVGFRSWGDVGGEVGEVDPRFGAWEAGRGGPGSKRLSGEQRSSGESYEFEETAGSQEGDGDEEIVFDSEDEDECEDIFAGVWDAKVVAKRRKGKVANLRRRRNNGS